MFLCVRVRVGVRKTFMRKKSKERVMKIRRAKRNEREKKEI